MIMPDGYCADLEKFVGADQQGATGVTGKLDNHWKSLIATAAIVGAVEGLGSIASASSSSGVAYVEVGMNREASQEGVEILRQKMNQPPRITIPEGIRVKLWVGEDLRVPAWSLHRVPSNL